jgi:hypothetical protein
MQHVSDYSSLFRILRKGKIFLLLLFCFSIVYADSDPLKEGQKYNNTNAHQPNIFEQANKNNNKTQAHKFHAFEIANKYDKTHPHQSNLFEIANKYNKEHGRN